MTPSEFVKIVVKQYNAGAGIFTQKVNAEDLIPQGVNELATSLYIFYVLQLDYAMKSQTLYHGAQRLYSAQPAFFNPARILELSDKSLADTLSKYMRPRYINEAVTRYRKNSNLLLEKYNGDPQAIFTKSDSCAQALLKVREFRGFGPKIGNFLVRTMINTFNYTYSDIAEMLPPVDVHDVRIAYLLGYTDSVDMTPKNINKVKKVWNGACIEAGESWLVFDKALWLLGSEGKPRTREDALGMVISTE